MASTIESMDWIFTYQYELMYSFGALFALFSMMSYVAPAVQSALERGDNGMDSSENFFEGFEGLDLNSIMSEDDVENENMDEVEPASFSAVTNIADHQNVEDIVTEDEVVIEEPAIEEAYVAEVFTEPVQEVTDAYEVSVEEAPETVAEEVVAEVETAKTISPVREEKAEEVVVASGAEIFEEEDDDVIDYFSQSNSDVSGMSIEDDEEEKYSAATQETIRSISEPVVDGFAKVASQSPVFEPVKEERLSVKSVQKKTKEVLKVAPQEMKKDLLVMRRREKLSVNKEEVLSLKKKTRSFGND